MGGGGGGTEGCTSSTVDYCPDYRGRHSIQKKKNSAASEKKTEMVKSEMDIQE